MARAAQRRRAGRGVRRLVERTEVTRLLAKAAGDIWIRSFLEGQCGKRQADQKDGSGDYNPQHLEDIMRAKALVMVALVAASVSLPARPAIDDNIDVKIEEWLTPSKPAYPHDPAGGPDR